ncbi:MAG TPA: PIG-L family deacetylase [Acetobacteraceae bacterium]|nr:PIG-L family deacetylase [Acetobacteraceae bacterium]
MIRAATMLAAFRAAPFAELGAVTGGGPILVLAPHPDDESLGFGGTIAAAVAGGIAVHIVVLTDGTGSHPGSRRYPPPRLKMLREAETCAAAATLGVAAEQVAFLEAVDSHAPTEGADFDALTHRLAGMIARVQARSLLTTWRHDPHCDHEAAALLGAAAAQAAGVRFLTAPVWGWTLPDDAPLPDPLPAAIRLDVAAYLPAKRRAIAAHVSQTTGLIDDSPDRFRLDPAFLALFDRPWEVLIPS